MTAFVIAIIALVLLALAFVVPVMFRKHELEVDTRDQLNIRIAKDRLAELRQDLDSGNITQQDFDQAREELEKTLALDLTQKDVDEVAPAETQTVATSKSMALFLLIGVPVFAGLLYAKIGFVDSIDREQPQVAEDPHASQAQPEAPQMTMEEAITKLQERLQQEPDNAEGWFMLARTYAAINEYDKAVPAFEKVIELVGEGDANLLLRYADALAMSQQGRLSGDALTYIEKALDIDPRHPQGLWMIGMALNEQGEYRRALESWYQVKPQIQDPQAVQQLDRMIAAVAQNVSPEELKAIKQEYVAPEATDSAAGSEIRVTVSLDEALKDQVSENDTVFIFARAVSGPPMPLAAVKQQVSALPITVTLTDDMAMMPNMKLSQFDQVTVGAKISRSGTAGPAPGDLFGERSPVEVSAGESIELVIDQKR